MLTEKGKEKETHCPEEGEEAHPSEPIDVIHNKWIAALALVNTTCIK